MAGFCAKCGSTMPSDTGFCPSCGAPATAANVPASAGFAPVAVPVSAPPPPPLQQAPPPSASYPPPAAYPVAQPAPPAKSGGALKIILIIVAVVVGLGVIAAGVVGYGIYKVAHSVHMDEKGNGTVSVLGSTISTGKNLDISADDLGVPFYPGAAQGEGGMHMSLPTGTVISAIYLTDDAPSTVEAFYKGKLGENESDMDSNGGTVMTAGTDAGNGRKNSIMLTIAPGTGDANGKTRITIVHTTANK